MATASGGLLAPIVAGTLIEHFWWGSVFLVALPVAALLLLLGPFLLPRSQSVGTARLDVALRYARVSEPWPGLAEPGHMVSSRSSGRR
ncbi:MAG TPA: hypothetical protein VIJ82_13550 [Streptosporangiaceae bacterium]